MFEVRSKINGSEYTVFAIDKEGGKTKFLTYCCDGWDWIDSDFCEPILLN